MKNRKTKGANQEKLAINKNYFFSLENADLELYFHYFQVHQAAMKLKVHQQRWELSANSSTS